MMSNHNGLVYAYVLDGSGGGRPMTWQDIRSWKPRDGMLWMHIDYTVSEARSWLEDKSGLNSLTCDTLMEDGTRPRNITSDEGLLLILRGVNCNPGEDPDDMVALRMFFTEHRLITMRQRPIMALPDISGYIESGNGPVSAGDFLVMIAERIADRMGDVISDIDDKVDEIEDMILTGETGQLRPQLADIRRQTIRLRRYIAPQRDVLLRLLHDRIPWLGEPERARLREVAERTARFVEDVDSARDRSAITQEEINNRLSEQMNKAMYLLSIVAAIFLPLGLLTGLLGINVGGIPGSENSLAFTFVTIGLVTIAVLLILWFKRIKWL